MASEWRKHAREIIDAALAALPATATRKEAERALREASPYADRRTGDGLSWGAKCWGRERKAALRRRFGCVGDRRDNNPDAPVTFRLAPRFSGPNADRRPWLSVVCPWCKGALKDETHSWGCLVCGPAWALVQAVVADPAFRGLRDAAKDPGLLGPLKDWLEERGILVEG